MADEKKRFAGRFQPYRKPKNPKVVPIDQALVMITEIISHELRGVVIASDTYPEKGAISIRDSKDQLWEIRIERSDALYLACEDELKRRDKG